MRSTAYPDRPSCEYKQVTVLFADVVHSMEIAASLGAERLREIMAALLDGSTAVVQRYGGTVDKFTGDGIMALFGAPTALEDHAFRACLAAIDIQQEAQRLAADVERCDGVTLELRVGLNSGQVIAGEIGSAGASYTAIGEQVGMAQRMESAAPPGGVMLSESTARLVDNAVALGDSELVQIKGSDAPVTARRLLAIAERQPRRRGESTLIGRIWELNTINGILDEAIAGAGCVVNVGDRRALVRADWSANRRRSRPSAVCPYSQPTASRTRVTSRSTSWRVCSVREWKSTISSPTPPGPRHETDSPMRTPKTSCCSRICWESGTRRWHCPRSPPTLGGGG